MAGTNRILFICDDEAITSYLREKLIIEAGYAVSFEYTSNAGLNALRQNNFDLVIMRFVTQDEEGCELIKGLKKIDPDCIIIVLLEEANPAALRQISQLGVYDFVVKPFNLEKLLFLVRKGIDLHTLTVANRRLSQSLHEQNISLQKQNTLLAKRIEESTKNLSRLYEDLRTTYMRTIKVLAQAIDARDHYTHSHSENVAKYAVLIAEEMGLSLKEIETIREACELHDLGKIGVVDSILSKPAGLTPEEFEQIKRHPIIGAQILEPLTFLSDVIELVRQHHEHYNGKGYPEGRKGEDILLGARIINLADAYEAMTSPRAYRKTPFTKEQAIAEINRNKGTQFDPKVVNAFLKIVDKI
jgi:putative nucleotidyltransferase with HDIG domain